MDKAQAELLIAEIVGKQIGDWTAEGKLGYGKSAVVLSAKNSQGTTGAVRFFIRSW